jgi:hypothetical protein
MITLYFYEKCQFFRRKSAKIAEISNHNIHPRSQQKICSKKSPNVEDRNQKEDIFAQLCWSAFAYTCHMPVEVCLTFLKSCQGDQMSLWEKSPNMKPDSYFVKINA